MYRHNIKFPVKDEPLRDDVHALGALVGEILLEQCGTECFERVEGDRVAAIRRRDGEPGGEAELLARTVGREPGQARDLVRAFSTWFQVVNLAEKVHRIRRRREYLNQSNQPQPGGLEEALALMAADGVSRADLDHMLASLMIYPVFTAHPTESTRRTILRKQQRVTDLLLDRLDPSMTPMERRATWEQIRTEITSGWQTEEHPRNRLTVDDEREHVLFFLAEILYRLVPGFYENLASAIESHFKMPVVVSELPKILRFGSWVGGDMDGSPDVHAKVIRETLQRQHVVILKNYVAEIERLGERLSQSASRAGVSRALQARINQYVAALPEARESAPARHDSMPYRQFCAQIVVMLRNTHEGLPHRYESAAQLAADLKLMADSLAAHRGDHAGLFYVHRLLRRLDTFQFYLATLDVRQHADVHRSVVGQGLGDPLFATRTSAERLERLRVALEKDEPPSETLDAAGRRCLAVFEQMMQCCHRYGREAIGDYVISGAEAADDVLAVLLLARWADIIDKSTGQVPIDITPLIDSMSALADSAVTMQSLFAEPCYQRHLQARDRKQRVMVGYGTSKEGGLMASRWALYQAQEQMSAVATAESVALTIAHGRVSATSRGTSRVATLFKSSPPGSFSGVLRATEQGDVIHQHYVLRPIAMRSLEQAFGAASQALVSRAPRAVRAPAWVEAFTVLSRVSAQAYRSRVHEAPGFFEYFRAATPIDVIERMQIGSRPTARSGRLGMDALRAVPFGFAWSQSRHFLSGWFGVGTGLDAVASGVGVTVLQAMMIEVPLFVTLFDEVEYSLAVADMPIAAWYAQLAPPEQQHHFAAILGEYQRTRDWVLRLRGERALLDVDTGIQRAMKLRNPYIDPMHLMQIDLLRRWRAVDCPVGDMQEALIASVGGISQGLQATG